MIRKYYRQTHDTEWKSHTTVTRHQEDKASNVTSSFYNPWRLCGITASFGCCFLLSKERLHDEAILFEDGDIALYKCWLVMRGSRNFRQGGPGQSDKKSADNFFLVLSLFYRSQMVNFKEIYHFSRFERGSNIFQGGSNFFQGVGGGVQLLVPFRNLYNLWFSRVGSGPPVPPSGSALACRKKP